VANSQDDASSQHPDLLAAVVLHTLVREGRDGITVASIAKACDRDPSDPSDSSEVEAALGVLLDDGLAEREHRAERDLWLPTRAAMRADELSF
jgi:hypothetical protein